MKKLFAALLMFLTFATGATIDRPCNIGETIGTVSNIYDRYVHVVGEPLTAAGHKNVIVNIADAPIFDLVTGYSAQISDVKKGMNIRIAYEVSEKKEPTALVIWLNCEHESSAVFTVVVSDNIQYGHNNCVFLSHDGKYRVTISHKTVIIDPYYGHISPSDIQPGQEFFVWVDTITASSPSLVYPDKVVLIYD